MKAAQMRAILDRYGQEAAVKQAGREERFRAFIQPLAERDEEAEETVTGIGTVDERLWLCLGQRALSDGGTVLWKGTAFRVLSCRGYDIGTERVYYRSVLVLAKEAAE